MGLTRRVPVYGRSAANAVADSRATAGELMWLAGARGTWMQGTNVLGGGITYVGIDGGGTLVTEMEVARAARDVRRGALDGPSVRGVAR